MNHGIGATGALWSLNSPATRMYVHYLIQADTNEDITGPLWGESIDHLTND